MCGIAGIFQPDRLAVNTGLEPNINLDTLRNMADSIVHRGPDDDGYYNEEGIGLAFRRLAIVDIAQGQQPIYSQDQRIIAICNGEIYNHQELRQHLIASGKQPPNHSDVAVIPHLYQMYGQDFVKHLQGQFAIALYDRDLHKLILVRDPVGIAPLYWTQIGEQFAFGSEIRTLLTLPGFKKSVNCQALDQLLTFPGIVSPTTFFSGVFSLKPGHMLVIENNPDPELQTTLIQYWELDYPLAEPTEKPFNQQDLTASIDQLDLHLQDAVQRRLQGDVPIAAYLSGGLDSSLIAALLTQVSPGAVKDSFSITFPSRSIDESQYQKMMAQHLGTKHHSFEVADQDIADHLQCIVNRAETPLRESYNACSLILSSMVAKEGIKAVVSGEGADELFAGYVGYRLNEHRDMMCGDLEEMLEQEMRQKLWGDPHLFYEKAYQAHREQKVYLYSEAVRQQHMKFDCLERELIDRRFVEGRHPIHQRSYLDFKLRMADHLLADHGDRVGFANSVECRFPFLDHNLIEFVRKLPPQWLLHNGEEKYLLKQLAKRYLPDAITERQKFSFVAPSSAILLRHHQEFVGDMLAPERIQRQGYFDPETVEHLRQSYLQPEHELNQTFEDDLLMIVLTFGIWLDEFNMPNYAINN